MSNFTLKSMLAAILMCCMAASGFAIEALTPIEVSIATGSTVTKLDKVTLTFDEEIEVDDEAEVAILNESLTDTLAKASLTLDFANSKCAVIDLGGIDSPGTYSIVIPEGCIWVFENEEKKIAKLTYTYTVDPEYWDPEWIVEVSGSTQESPVELVAGRKYQFSDMRTYMTYTATENGRLYFKVLDDRSYISLSYCADDWYIMGNLAKNEEGASWIGVEAGKTIRLTDYELGTRLYQVTFEAGNPYETIEFTGTFPQAGGLLSKSIESPKSYEMGAVEFYFNTKVNTEVVKVYMVIPSQDNKKVEITEDVQLVDGTVYGTNISYLAVVMGTSIDLLKSEYGLKAGDKLQIVLENVQDINFAANALTENPQVEVVLAATVCTSVNPSPEYSVDSVPATLSLRFDGNVTCANGKGYIVDVKSGEKQTFAIENFECEYVESWSNWYEATITLPALEKELTGKQFNIEIEGLTDTEGNAISYGDEIGKFILEYKMSDAAFNYVTADPEDGAELTSIKTTKLTFGDEVHIGPDASAYFYYGDYIEVTGEFAIDPTDPKSVIITWSEEISQPGSYNINIAEGSIYDSGYDESKEDLGLADGAYYNPGIYLEYSIPADVSTTTVASVSPVQYSFWDNNSLEKLPTEVVIEFEGNVKEVTTVYGQQSLGGGWSAKATLPEGATTLAYTLEGNKMTVTLPAEVVSSMTSGSYTITVYATGEDGKPISYAFDSWGDRDMFAENISFSYKIQKSLKLTETTPANFSTVKELSTITLTFNEELAAYDRYADTPCLLNAADDSKVADFSYTVSGNQLTLTLEEPVTATGSYAAYIPDWAIETVSGLYNEAPIYVFVDVDPNHVAEETLTIVSATPESGATIESLTTVEFKLNKEVGYLYKSMLIPADGADDAASASLTQSETDPTSYTLDFTIGGFLKDGAALRKGITYTLTLEAWASEEAYNLNQGTPETVTLTYVGASEGFKYSDVKMESITPNEETVISDKTQNKFVVKFSGAVELVESLTYINMGQGATQAFESITSNEDKTEYTLTIAESLMATMKTTINFVFAANDLNGNRVEGNSGEGEFSCFSVEYVTTIGVPDLTVTSGEVEELSVISIKCNDGLTPSWLGKMTLVDAEGNAIALNEPEAVIPEDKANDYSYVPVEWTVSLTEKVSTKGDYTLTIPAGYFNIGSTQGQIVSSKETVVTITVTGSNINAIHGISIDADTNVTVYDVTGVLVGNGKASDVLTKLTKGLYIVNGKKLVIR